MSLKPWKKVSDELIKKNPWWEYRLMKFDVGGTQVNYHCVYETPGVMVIPVRDDGKILMVKQLRVLLGRESLEFVAGGSENADSNLEAASGELAEEGGLRAENLIFIGFFDASPGRSNKQVEVFTASQLSETTAEGDEAHEIDPFWFAPDEIDEMIKSGELRDAWSITAWSIAKPRVLAIIDAQRLKG
ncbi:hypothetical protein CO057_03275 [Candidatus Uhrbacteria bacterium CG_4_9_14_0_2_um_filter_41_50]|uniref:Nudix hydrolase domain-containing protein n=1 Tax=Candidatus Uhrbacteria bacterium CG_4_9_14_0_2_um_filter_41_50 TaxID=1975031 RepID=A0A2M8ENK5_9BACT|nr:MAG: hypothetical protein COZ45_03595 [Candidatus Uhrbacteria bacterium CG_4_10_14_3_um_filter_41_21]PIZ55117.1 MAG: hypothetical protein COY24_01640 [Candidatus Uhrbacteria bacterium CG_4_10_14_0_2_um_filter_41_21]PJB84447.1 MAG: hypothetical protein CO086_03765 [Candidatus Uhrbacteria bacterium CG_4_9_14_0_8_um_filter_41_16]PJC24320.1 MAG: hypothetical protein CO057_03275 [Candidatus Uhrbacteria bacterium CG_4_9_14_0_2_um_filter_41_50]PJE75317.1 MAG: hypothetical protein COV03_00930 [Candi